jgi:hypothetical protein
MFGDHLVRSHTAVLPHKSKAREALHQSRREKVWAWLSLVILLLCWDASIRLDERVSPHELAPRISGKLPRLEAYRLESADTRQPASHGELVDRFGTFVGDNALEIQCVSDRNVLQADAGSAQ